MCRRKYALSIENVRSALPAREREEKALFLTFYCEFFYILLKLIKTYTELRLMER